MVPHVTLLYGGLLGLLIAVLGINVTRLRVKLKVDADHEAPKPLFFAIRAHGNAVEWAPFLIALLLVLELSGASALWLHVAGGALFLGRLLHAVGFVTRLKTAVPGILVTWLVAVWVPVWALLRHFGG
ncbi:MAG: MAPEG family protein [Myxococcota bacterium]